MENYKEQYTIREDDGVLCDKDGGEIVWGGCGSDDAEDINDFECELSDKISEIGFALIDEPVFVALEWSDNQGGYYAHIGHEPFPAF